MFKVSVSDYVHCENKCKLTFNNKTQVTAQWLPCTSSNNTLYMCKTFPNKFKENRSLHISYTTSKKGNFNNCT